MKEKKKDADGEVLWISFGSPFFPPPPSLVMVKVCKYWRKGLFFLDRSFSYFLACVFGVWVHQNRRREMKTTRRENPIRTFNLGGLLFFKNFVRYGMDGVGAAQYALTSCSGLPVFFPICVLLLYWQYYPQCIHLYSRF